MFDLKTLGVGALAVMIAGPALAEAKIYRYHTHQNYCPTGLEPISINGVVCCGTPNQNITYQQALRHPVAKKKHKTHRHVHKAKSVHTCPEGVKGCF